MTSLPSHYLFMFVFFSLTNSTVSETNPNKKSDTETSNACLYLYSVIFNQGITTSLGMGFGQTFLTIMMGKLWLQVL